MKTSTTDYGARGFDAETEEGLRIYSFPGGVELVVTRDGLRLEAITATVDSIEHLASLHPEFLRHLSYAMRAAIGPTPFVATHRNFGKPGDHAGSELIAGIKREGARIVPGYVDLFGKELHDGADRVYSASVVIRADHPSNPDIALHQFFDTMYTTAKGEANRRDSSVSSTPPMKNIDFNEFLRDIRQETGRRFELVENLSRVYFGFRPQ
jgi:hypothetical protein